MKILHHPGDVRSVLFVLLALTAYGVQWAGVLRHPVICVASFCLAFFGCVINHNHQHHPSFVPSGLNKLFGALISLAIGVPATAVVAMHNFNHHVHNNHADDFVRCSIVRFRWNLLNLLLFPLAAVSRYVPVKSRELAAWRTQRPALYRQLWLERLTLYPLLGALLLAGPMETLLFIILPYLFGQWGILAINHVQHDGCDPDSQYNHARNFTGRWLNWWVFNNGFHTAHHQQPGRHWSRLPELHAQIRGRLDPDLERRSLLAAVLQFYVWPGRPPVLKGMTS